MRGAGRRMRIAIRDASCIRRGGRRRRSRESAPALCCTFAFSLSLSSPAPRRSPSTSPSKKKTETHHHVVRGPDVDSHPIEDLQARSLCERREGSRSGGRRGRRRRRLFLESGRDGGRGRRGHRRNRAEWAQAADVASADHRRRRLALCDRKGRVDLLCRLVKFFLHREERDVREGGTS